MRKRLNPARVSWSMNLSRIITALECCVGSGGAPGAKSCHTGRLFSWFVRLAFWCTCWSSSSAAQGAPKECDTHFNAPHSIGIHATSAPFHGSAYSLRHSVSGLIIGQRTSTGFRVYTKKSNCPKTEVAVTPDLQRREMMSQLDISQVCPPLPLCVLV